MQPSLCRTWRTPQTISRHDCLQNIPDTTGLFASQVHRRLVLHPKDNIAWTKHFLCQTLWPSVQESTTSFGERAAQNTLRAFWCLVKIQHYTKPFPKAIIRLARTGFPSFPLAQIVAEPPVRIFPACRCCCDLDA